MNLFKEVNDNLKEQEELFEMSNLKAQRTNLLADLWVEEKGEGRQKSDKLPRVKIKTINHGLFPISISAVPKALMSTEEFKKEDLEIIRNAKPFIKRNRDILLKFYNGEIDIEDLLGILAERGDYKRNK